MEEEDEGSPEEHLELKEMREMLDKAIDELPEKCRLVFLMSREEGLKTKEIAEILSVQESTVRVQMKIAIEKLVARLKPSFTNISFSLLLRHSLVLLHPRSRKGLLLNLCYSLWPLLYHIYDHRS